AAGDGPYSTTHAGRMLGFARDNDLPAVISNAARMLDRSDGPVADILDCSRNLAPLHESNVERRNSEGFFKNSKEMVAIADLISRAAGERNSRHLLKETAAWAERAILSPVSDLGLGAIHLPEHHVVGAKDELDMARLFRERCFSGLNWRYGASTLLKKAEARLDDELTTVRTLGYESYFLTVADITDTARASGIRVAARGSGAGSLICHVLGISGVEPIAHGLLMERFCSPLRRALPDIDIDVESARRLEIYNQVFSKYGDPNWRKPGNSSRCATVAMVDTYRARHAIRDTGAALGLPPMEIDLIAKSIPHVRARNISQALDNLPELKNLNLNTPLIKMAIGLAERLDGLPRNLSMHPCAIVLSDGAFLDRAPIQINASGYPMVQFDKDDVEAIGLLKLDVLGVRMQSSLSYAVQEIERSQGITVDLDSIPLDDPKTFELIQSTKTLGLFQIESPGQRELIGKFAPETFTDLIIDISLFRPGPVKSDMIKPFLNARHGWKSPQIFHPDLYEALHETEGVVVFHEQVIRIISTLTGISFAEADEKRRALSSPEGQQEVCDWFYPAALSKGYQLPVVTEIWEVLRAFASFGFCKAHAAAFALPTYQSAWLKTHYPAAFLAGVLTHDPGMYPKRLMMDEVRQLGIGIGVVDVNHSTRNHRVEVVGGRESIRLALQDISGISDGEITSIENGQPYLDLADFVRRSGASQPICEALVLIGGFDSLYNGLNRRDLLLNVNDLYRWSRSATRLGGGQLTLGFTPELEASGLPKMTKREKVSYELDHLGMDVSHHVIEFYAAFLNEIGAVRSSELLAQRSESSVLVAGIKVALQTPPVRSGRRVIFLTLNDGYGCSDITFFEDMQSSYAQLLYGSSLFLIRGIIRRTGARGISLRATGAWELSAEFEKWRNLTVCER
ncbi:MAG: DNA polymerase III subunit alpha, partial [Actinobacteria bacterium]|nr:DNA polymerase III subunit alpha [Actinomycetota bacterium]